MVMEPKLLLLDEPLSNLDARLRLDIRAELRRVQKDTGVITIFVTRDQAEALALADRIVVMRSGAVEQIGSPEDIYNHPVSRFVADFVGFENIFTVRDGQLYSDTGVIPLAAELPKATGLAFRPSAVVLGAGPLSASVRNVSFAGNVRGYVLETAFGLVWAEAAAALPPYRPGETIAFDLPVDRATVLERD
jgi:putative spermidine/putrescine transport system ATP-binding protein